MKAKLLGYFPCNPSNANELLFPLLAAFLLRLSPRPSAGLGAALLSEIARSWWIQATGLPSRAKCRERSLSSLQPRGQVFPGGLPTKCGPSGSSPESAPVALWGGRRKQPARSAPSAAPAGFGAQAGGSHWSDPVVPKASLSSLLVSMKNDSVIAPDGTQTNLDRQLRPTHFQGLGLTSVLFPLVPI